MHCKKKTIHWLFTTLQFPVTYRLYWCFSYTKLLLYKICNALRSVVLHSSIGSKTKMSSHRISYISSHLLLLIWGIFWDFFWTLTDKKIYTIFITKQYFLMVKGNLSILKFNNSDCVQNVIFIYSNTWYKILNNVFLLAGLFYCYGSFYIKYTVWFEVSILCMYRTDI